MELLVSLLVIVIIAAVIWWFVSTYLLPLVAKPFQMIIVGILVLMLCVALLRVSGIVLLR
jgi:hypothetical protein